MSPGDGDPAPTTIQSNSSNHHHPLSHLLQSIFSYNSNVMLAAFVSLLLVVVFVLLLHVYAKWFLAHAHRRPNRPITTVSRVFGPAARFHAFPASSLSLDLPSSASQHHSKGLEPSAISAIPLFIHKSAGAGDGLNGLGPECVVCLSGLEDGDVGRRLPKCGHAFHLDCIDMWLASHSNCPICRAPVVVCDEKASATGTFNSAGREANSTEAVPPLADAADSVVVDVLGSGDSEDADCSSSSSSSSFGCSLKRMLSRNRSEGKVFPATSVNE
ncbi:43kDa postsynaptic protein [Parasponia andersonii]|uniref:RING-type E3 ubiquitin transferase n=1 Tax=Parasponia andersonii TaxID=3476 RepID=A0A2P5C925_PARAD|nr:43kDa postsynaptic protein [Parasponia andersonii]